MDLSVLKVPAFFLLFYHMFRKEERKQGLTIGVIMRNFLSRQFRKMGEVKFGMVLLLVGAVLGVVSARILKGFYWNNINILNNDYITKMKETQIDYDALRGYVYWHIFKPFILFWIVCITTLGIPYIGLCLAYIGFQGSFLTSILLMKYGFKGILLLFGYTFPHYIIYIPVMFLCFRSGFYLCKALHYDNMSRKGRSDFILKQGVFIVFLGIVLAFGGFLETYANTFILRQVLGLF